MSALVLKLLLTPALIGAATVAQRRIGAVVAGLIVGLPLTSAPVALFLALEHGKPFAATAAVGTIAGLAAETAFCLAYAQMSRRRRYLACVAIACLAFAAVRPLLRLLPTLLWPTYLGVLLVIALGRAVIPSQPVAHRHQPPPQWDLPARMALATAIVFALTSAAGYLGPHLSGLLSPFPVYAGVLAAFTHAVDGPDPARQLLRGVLGGLFAFASFFAALALALRHLSIGDSFALATIAALLIQGAALASTQRRYQLISETASSNDYARDDG
jgi:hypothetical protein